MVIEKEAEKVDELVWPYRWVCHSCEAWLGVQNPDDTCDTCKWRRRAEVNEK
jgi:hypothetical protein